MRYAEEQQDLALLSISTFQRALKVTNCFTIKRGAIKNNFFFFKSKFETKGSKSIDKS